MMDTCKGSRVPPPMLLQACFAGRLKPWEEGSRTSCNGCCWWVPMNSLAAWGDPGLTPTGSQEAGRNGGSLLQGSPAEQELQH